MALIRNAGRYMVTIIASGKNWQPGERIDFNRDDLLEVSGTIDEIPEGDCKYVKAENIPSGASAVIIGDDSHVIVSARIGPHDFLEFNGEKFLDINQGTGNCSTNHGW